jgi:hypothetical protein
MSHPYEEIDRIDNKGNITAHMRKRGSNYTLCGLRIIYMQNACGNGMCRRCSKIYKTKIAVPVVTADAGGDQPST